MTNALEDQIRSIVASYAGLSCAANEITETDDLYDLGMTSSGNVNVMLALEDQFDIEFPEDMLVRETFATIGAIMESVRRLRPPADSISPA